MAYITIYSLNGKILKNTFSVNIGIWVIDEIMKGLHPLNKRKKNSFPVLDFESIYPSETVLRNKGVINLQGSEAKNSLHFIMGTVSKYWKQTNTHHQKHNGFLRVNLNCLFLIQWRMKLQHLFGYSDEQNIFLIRILSTVLGLRLPKPLEFPKY